MTIAAARLNIIRQLLQRGFATLAIVGILALVGTVVSFTTAAALYAEVSIVHALWTMFTLGGVRIPVTTPKKEKVQLGFVCPTIAVASSAERVREETRNQQ